MRSILGCLGGSGKTEAMADGIAVAEEQLDELLIDHGDGRRIQRVLRGESRPITTCVPTESKYSGVAFTQEAPLLMSGSPWTFTPELQLLSSIGV